MNFEVSLACLPECRSQPKQSLCVCGFSRAPVDAKVVSLAKRREERARAEVPRCGDGCTWELPSLLVHGLSPSQKASITFACPKCGSEYTADVE